MKTTLDLPDDLVRKVKLHALDRGQKLKEAVAELLRMGLAAPARSPLPEDRPVIKQHPQTGLPYVECSSDAPARRMTAAELIALEQQTQTQEDFERLGVFTG